MFKELDDFLPSYEVLVAHKGRLVCHKKSASRPLLYDLASLTKIIFTATALMQVSSEDSKFSQRKVQSLLPWWPNSHTTLENLMTHSSGLIWWVPLYEKLNRSFSRQERYVQLAQFLKELAPPASEKKHESVYSDAGVLLLGLCLEQLWGAPLERVYYELRSLGLIPASIHFHLDNLPLKSKQLYAPTENCSFRKRRIQGEVHDENTWALGGLAPHAGLFGDAKSIHAWHQNLRKKLPEKTVKLFTAKHVENDFGYLFMKPSQGKASCGNYFSEKSYGHLGFTGTSFWYDPKKQVEIIFLSNRTYPQRNKRDMRELRPRIHNWLMEEFIL